MKAFSLGVTFAVIVIAYSTSSTGEKFKSKGSMNTGHELLSCTSCHQAAEGSIRQQLQAKAKYFLNLRKHDNIIGNQEVSSHDCLSCHQRETDRHPIFRFNEPRFAKAAKDISANNCIGCHKEHTGKRVTIKQTYCINCHDKMKLQNDPINPTHANLALNNKWNSCLRCHDYHGNHIRKTPILKSEMLNTNDIRNYFHGGKSPYSKTKKHLPQKERSNE